MKLLTFFVECTYILRGHFLFTNHLKVYFLQNIHATISMFTTVHSKLYFFQIKKKKYIGLFTDNAYHLSVL